MNGYGRAQYSNGDIYEGYFKRGDMSGLGLYYQLETKTHILGTFTDNKMAEQINKYEDTEVFDMSFSTLSSRH